MRHFVYSLILLTGMLTAFFWYCAALIDWIEEFSSGYYAHHRTEEVFETAGILIYTYFGIRFFRKKIDFLG